MIYKWDEPNPFFNRDSDVHDVSGVLRPGPPGPLGAARGVEQPQGWKAVEVMLADLAVHQTWQWTIRVLICFNGGYSCWLVVWNIFSIQLGISYPNWLIFFRGVGIPPTRLGQTSNFAGVLFSPPADDPRASKNPSPRSMAFGRKCCGSGEKGVLYVYIPLCIYRRTSIYTIIYI